MSPLYITDVVQCIELALHISGRLVTINLAGDHVISIRDLAQAIGHVLHIQPKFEETRKITRNLAGSNRRMRIWLGIAPAISLSEGLALTFPPIES